MSQVLCLVVIAIMIMLVLDFIFNGNKTSKSKSCHSRDSCFFYCDEDSGGNDCGCGSCGGDGGCGDQILEQVIKMNEVKLEGKFEIKKSSEEKRLAFGWASVANIVDSQGDVIDAEELEQAAYNFVRFYREGGEMHERGGCAELVESIIFTPEKLKALGLPENTLSPCWWIGFYVTDDEVWNKVKSGEYSMFSIEGKAIREEI